MKIKITKRDLELLGIQAEAWLVLMLVPAITTFFSTHSWMDTYHALTYSMRIIAMPAGVYFVNFCILIPLCYYRGRRWLFLWSMRCSCVVPHGIISRSTRSPSWTCSLTRSLRKQHSSAIMPLPHSSFSSMSSGGCRPAGSPRGENQGDQAASSQRRNRNIQRQSWSG